MAKSKKAALSKQAAERSARVNHRMHADVGFTRNCNWTFQLFVDDYTRVSYLVVLESKATVLDAWVELKTHLENKHQPWKFAYFKSDSEAIYTTEAWAEHCKSSGIIHEFSSRYRHDQNGVVEKCMDVVGTTFRVIMIQGNAPERFSGDALEHANVIRNWSPTKANKG
jgi:hypothetical protein